jgi:hypothetical protein
VQFKRGNQWTANFTAGSRRKEYFSDFFIFNFNFQSIMTQCTHSPSQKPTPSINGTSVNGTEAASPVLDLAQLFFERLLEGAGGGGGGGGGGGSSL